MKHQVMGLSLATTAVLAVLAGAAVPDSTASISPSRPLAPKRF